MFKTSKSDTESGQLDLAYYRDGLTIDANSTLLTGIARPLQDRLRLYLAGQGPCVREKSGFVA